MNLFIEFYLIQNFVLFNFNCDDIGVFKDVIFGGYCWVCVSSQCFKCVICLIVYEQELVVFEYCGVCIKKFKVLLLEWFVGCDFVEVEGKIEMVLVVVGFKFKDDGKIEYLLFFGEVEIVGFVVLIEQCWDELGSVVLVGEKKGKKEVKVNVLVEVIKQVRVLFDGGKVVDVVLFGWMFVDLFEVNQDVVCQVVYVISIYCVECEFDYFIVVDDCGGLDESGVGMIGQVEFNFVMLYCYVVVDLCKLFGNLQNDGELVLLVLEVFIQVMVWVILLGKQNIFVVYNLLVFVGICLCYVGLLNLVNVFEKLVVVCVDVFFSECFVVELVCYDQ